jgi:membrane-bound lytic murein transglycosylase
MGSGMVRLSIFLVSGAAFAQSVGFADRVADTEKRPAQTRRDLSRDDLMKIPGFKECVEPILNPKPKMRDCSGSTKLPHSFEKVGKDALPKSAVVKGDIKLVLAALDRAKAHCEKQPAAKQNQKIDLGGTKFTRKELCIDSNKQLHDIATQPAITFEEFLEQAKKKMQFYQLKCDGKKDIGYTGYYTPIFEGSPKPVPGRYTVPLYGRPEDLIIVEKKVVVCEGQPGQRTETQRSTHRILPGKRLPNGQPATWKTVEEYLKKNPDPNIFNTLLAKKPDGSFDTYFTREQINSGKALQGRGLEVAYVRTPWEAANAQIQGTLILEEKDANGKLQKRHFLNFAEKNGKRWTGVGGVVKCVTGKGYSMDGLTEWFRQNPDKAEAVMNFDESFVFFSNDDKPPLGVDNITLTPQHCVALDRNRIDVDIPMIISTTAPVLSEDGKLVRNKDNQPTYRPFQTIATGCDVGGAIKGCRMDYYAGEGAAAGTFGGGISAPGPVFIIAPR